MNDFTIQERVCNLRCSYCLNFENEFKGGDPWTPPENIDLREGGKGWTRSLRVLKVCSEKADAPILRISGGEIFALRGAMDFIEEAAKDWHRVQIITNATLLDEWQIERLAALPNLNLVCSVDGHTIEANALRTRHNKLAQRIVDGLRRAIDAGIPLEVNTIITCHNAEIVYDFAWWMYNLPRRADLRFFPFPVRGKIAKQLVPTSTQVESFRRLLRDYEELANILPPQAYLDQLLYVYDHEHRGCRCLVPLAYMQTFDDGEIGACTNCWTSASLGNLLMDDHPFKQVGIATIHKIFLRDPPRFPFCRGCFTPFDVVNLYFDNECTLFELSQINLYSTPQVQTRLAKLKAAWERGSPTAVWQ
jgi:MoaA/NifB/PqqE/SkfB family radical SAM enzyme